MSADTSQSAMDTVDSPDAIAPVSDTDELTRTEVAVRRAPRSRRGRLGRWLRRRPVRRTLVITHRWTSLILGLFLVIECTSGAVLEYRGELFRATHGDLYEHTVSANPISAQQAFDMVNTAHPEFGAAWVSNDAGILAVGDADYAKIYAVDPGSGRITGPVALSGGVLGWLANLHDCGFGCKDYAGYVSWMGAPIDGSGALTWGKLALVVLGLLMVLLVITGIITWWPGIRRMSHGFRVRKGKGRFARDYDLHNVIGIATLPFLLMWGVTGAAFYLPAAKDTWLAVTGGHSVDEKQYSFDSNPAPEGTPELGINRAAEVAIAAVPGSVRYLTSPSESTPYYSVSVAQDGYAPYNYRPFYGGDTTVYVDSHDAAHIKVVGSGEGEAAANTFYDRVFEPAHFGWLANGWWRIAWVVVGLAPLVLAVTSLSTWLFRRGTKRRRKRAKAQAARA